MNSVANWISDKTIDLDAVNHKIAEAMRTNVMTNSGPQVRELELLLREKLEIGDEYSVVACVNGTAAIHALVSGIGMFYGKKMRWVTQDFTFPASAQGILDEAAIVDIDEGGGLNLNLVDTANCDGIIVTNVFGNVVDIVKQEEWARANDKILLFDSAATPFTFYRGRNCLNQGHGSIISLHHTKPIGFGEGGAIVCQRIYEEHIRRVLNFGINNKLATPWSPFGSNQKMSEIAAIQCAEQIRQRWDDILETNYKKYKQMREEFSPHHSLFPTFEDENAQSIHSCLCVLDIRATQNVIHTLNARGIQCRKYQYPLKNMAMSSRLFNNIICLPCHQSIRDEEIGGIVRTVNEVLKQGVRA